MELEKEHEMGRYTTGGIGRDVIAGALAGAAAVWVIDKLDWSLYHSGGKKGIRATEAARPGGMDPAHALAAKAADKVGVNIGDRGDNAAGHVIHYGIGMGMGALYGLLRGMAPGVSTGRGALFGMAMFIVQDEIGNTALGLASNPLDYPIRDHARGAVAHTLFGIVTDLGTRLMSPWRSEVVVLRGPNLSERIEHGRHALEDGRDYLYEHGRPYLEQGRGYLGRARDYVGRFADEAVSRASEVDWSGLAERGRKGASRFADEVRSRTPDADEVSDLAGRGRKRARRFADDVRSRVPDADEVADLARRGRKQARRFARDARSQMPDTDDMADLAERGRKGARRFAADARSQAEEYGGSGVSRAMRWLFG